MSKRDSSVRLSVASILRSHRGTESFFEIFHRIDHPGIEKKDSALEVGKGPAITVSDAEGRGIIVPEHVLKWLREAAESNNIPYQLKVGTGGTTDVSAVYLTKEGIPTGVISTPSRYIHTPVTVLDMSDLEKSAGLIARAIEIADRFF